jgi:hypothetical protein
MRLRTACVIFGSVGIVGCGAILTENDYVIRGNTPGTAIKLIRDSPEVRELIALEETQAPAEVHGGEALLLKSGAVAIVERRQHPERYFPEHVKFVEAMTHQVGPMAPVGSYARVLERSHAKCERDPSLSAEYWKVMVKDGPMRGEEGWLCYLKDLFPVNPVE